MRSTFWLMTILFAVTAAADEPKEQLDLRIGPAAQLSLKLSGKHELDCESRWHKLSGFSSKLKGKWMVSSELQRRLMPGKKVPVGSHWQLSAEAVKGLCNGFHAAIRVEPGDAATYARWLGSKPTPKPLKDHGGVARLKLASVTRVEGSRRANLELGGRIKFTDSGSMASRYGPNSWTSKWSVELAGVFVLDLDRAVLVSAELAFTGTVKGRYFNLGFAPVDEFTIAISSRLLAGPLPKPTPAQRERIASLIGLLADKKFSTREQATRDLAKLGLVAKRQLLEALGTTKDLEVQHRCKQLLKALD